MAILRLFPGITDTRDPIPFVSDPVKNTWLRMRPIRDDCFQPSQIIIDLNNPVNHESFFDFHIVLGEKEGGGAIKSLDDDDGGVVAIDWLDSIDSKANPLASGAICAMDLLNHTRIPFDTSETRHISVVAIGPKRTLTISFQVLIILPFPHPHAMTPTINLMKDIVMKHNSETSEGSESESDDDDDDDDNGMKQVLLIGHRGSGANNGLPYPQLLENSLASLVNAARIGVDFVEFGMY